MHRSHVEAPSQTASIRRRSLAALSFAVVLLVSPMTLSSVVVAAGEGKPPAGKAGAAKQAQPQPKPSAPPGMQKVGSLAEQYCRAIRDAAAEARFAHQSAELKAIGKSIDERIAALEARTAELKEWFARREEFAKVATEQLVSIYAAMRTEAASEQLSKMDETAAAAILGRLDARGASAILNDIQPEKAARLATILAGLSRKSIRGDKS